MVKVRSFFFNTEQPLTAGAVSPITLRRTKATFVLGAALEIESEADANDKSTLRGMKASLSSLPVPPMSNKTDDDGPFLEVLVPEHFPPGSVIVLATEMEGMDASLDKLCVSEAVEAFAQCDLIDLNVVIFRADGEERDVTGGDIGAYDVPDMGKLAYCGLEGWMHPLRHIMRYNDLGHPLCGHLRKGFWACDYVVDRLERCAHRFRFSARIWVNLAAQTV